MARGAAIACVLAMGCGRFGFEDRSSPGDDADGGLTMDVAPGTRCSAAIVPGVDIGPQAPVRGMAGTGTPLGFALAFQRGDQSAVDGLVVAPDRSSGMPASPARATPVDGVTGEYPRVVLQWDGARILGGLVSSGGNFFWKVFPDTMGQFTSAVEETPPQEPAVPFLAISNEKAYAVSYAGPQITAWELDGNGIPTGASTSAVAGGAILSAGVAARSSTASLAIVDVEGTGLLVFDVPIAGGASLVLDGEGSRPRVTGTKSQVFVTYVRAGELVARTLDSSTSQISDPRVVTTSAPGSFDSAQVAGQLRVVWTDAAGFHIGVDGVPFATVDVAGLPAGAPDAWTLVGRAGEAAVFAAYDGELWSFPICR